MRSAVVLNQGSRAGKGGAAMWSTGARTRPIVERLRLDQPPADRVANELDAVAHPELAQHVRAVGLDRLLGQMQDLRDLRIGVRLGDQLHDLLLPGSQRTR